MPVPRRFLTIGIVHPWDSYSSSLRLLPSQSLVSPRYQAPSGVDPRALNPLFGLGRLDGALAEAHTQVGGIAQLEVVHFLLGGIELVIK